MPDDYCTDVRSQYLPMDYDGDSVSPVRTPFSSRVSHGVHTYLLSIPHAPKLAGDQPGSPVSVETAGG